MLSPLRCISVDEVIDLTGAKIIKQSHGSCNISSIASLVNAHHSSLSFFNGAFAYKEHLISTKAGFCLVSEKFLDSVPDTVVPIISHDPYFDIARVLHLMYGDGEFFSSTFFDIIEIHGNEMHHGISKNAYIASDAKIGNSVKILPGSYIGSYVEIGDNVTIHSNVSIERCKIGNNSIVRSGARIGSAGFGFVPDMKNGRHLAIPQIAGVVIGERVDIGSNVTIDRGFLDNTTIGDDTKIDNMVHIGHGTQIGKSCFFAGCSVIAGSVQIGNFVMVGGKVAITNNVIVADYTQITGGSCLTKSTKTGSKMSGYPALDHSEWAKSCVMIKNLVKKNNEKLQ